MAGGAETARDATAAPRATPAPDAAVARRATNKDDDDIKKRKSSSKGPEGAGQIESVEDHSRAAAPRERQESAAHDFAVVRAAYEKATGNRWTSSDSEAYDETGIGRVPVGRVLSVLESVPLRTPAKINSFKYFVKEIVTAQDPRNRMWQKKQLEKIVRRIRDNAVGRAGYSTGDLVEDIKVACARETILFDNDLFNQVMR